MTCSSEENLFRLETYMRKIQKFHDIVASLFTLFTSFGKKRPGYSGNFSQTKKYLRIYLKEKCKSEHKFAKKVKRCSFDF